MRRFGTDKPDLRYKQEIVRVEPFGNLQEVHALVLDEAQTLKSRKQRIDGLNALAQDFPAASEVHLVLVHVNPGG